jgi:beta-glucanase (GH16 family)
MTTYHDWTTGTVPYQNWSNTSSLTSAFHIWGFLWTPTAMTVYLDGKLMNTTSTPPVMQQPYYLVVDLGLGGGWPTGNTPPTNIMLVDISGPTRRRDEIEASAFARSPDGQEI